MRKKTMIKDEEKQEQPIQQPDFTLNSFEQVIKKTTDKGLKEIEWWQNKQELSVTDVDRLVKELKTVFNKEELTKGFDLYYDFVISKQVKKYLMKKFKVKE